MSSFETPKEHKIMKLKVLKLLLVFLLAYYNN